MRSAKAAVPLFLIILIATPLPGAALDFLLTRNQRAQKLVEEGQRQILRGDYPRAIDSCTRALGIRDDWGPAYLCRSEARLLTRDAVAADRDARRAGSLDPRNGEPFRILGILEFQAGRYLQAIERFDQALKFTKLKPENVSDVYYYRASSHLKLGHFQQALKDVEEGLGVLRGVNGDYGDWGFYSLRAEIYRQMGDESRADENESKVLRLIDERMRAHPAELLELLRRRAETHTNLRDYSAAAKDLDLLLAYMGDDVKALMDQAEVYYLAGRYADAIEDLDRALGIVASQAPLLDHRILRSSDFGHYYWLRAECRCKLGRLRDCLEDMRKARSLDPGSAFLALRLAQVHRQSLDRSAKASIQDLRKSKAYYDRAAALQPLDAASSLDRARTMIDLAARLQGRGGRLEGMDLLRQAARECAQVLRQHPANQEARRLLDRARKSQPIQ